MTKAGISRIIISLHFILTAFVITRYFRSKLPDPNVRSLVWCAEVFISGNVIGAASSQNANF